MISIGNDIIDLKTIDISRTSKPRFYSKILSPAEQLLYNEGLQIPFPDFVWLLWSVKESAYKCLQRHSSDLIFSPVKIEVRELKPPTLPANQFSRTTVNKGFNERVCFQTKVVFEGEELYARSILYGEELIYTVVCLQDSFENVHWGIKKIAQTDPENQSAAVRVFLLDSLRLLYPEDQISLQKSDAGVPFININGQEAAMPVSLSHHGEYVGYCSAIN